MNLFGNEPSVLTDFPLPRQKRKSLNLTKSTRDKEDIQAFSQTVGTFNICGTFE